MTEPTTPRFRRARGGKFELTPPVTRRTFLYIAAIVLGSVLIGTGTNLVLFRTGVRDDPSVDVVATIIGCGDLGMCVASYELDDKTVQATYFLEGREPPPDNSQVEAILYPGHEERLYASADVPVWVSVVLLSIGLPLVLFFCVKLYKHWRGEFRSGPGPQSRGRSERHGRKS